MKKVLLTGATGLIGRHAIKPITDLGYDLYCITSKKNVAIDLNIKFIEADLFNEKDIEYVFKTIKPDYLLHFAWIANGDYLVSDINYKWLNSSLLMLEEFKKNGGIKAVYAGTCFEYMFKNTPLKETDEINPTTVYAKCKNQLREKAEVYCSKNNILFGWGRIFYVYGDGEDEKRLFPSIINTLKNEKKLIIKSGKLIKDYMYTKDIANAFVSFLFSNVIGIVNICSGQGVTIKDFVNTIVAYTGKKDLIDFIDEAQSQPPVIVGDNTRLQNEVGFKCLYSLNNSLDDLFVIK